MKKFGSKTLIKSALMTIAGAVMAALFAVHASAMTPTLTISNTSYGSEQVTVYGDPNASVILDYYSGGQLYGAGVIGYTNYSGYYSGQLYTSNYNIPNGAQVVVIVNGQQSASAVWQGNGYNNGYPNGNYGGTITLSQNNVSLNIGQSQNIYITNTYNNGYNQYYVSNNNGTNNVVTATVSGTTITVYGQSAGSGNITVCSSYSTYYNSNCATLYVSVNGYTNNNNCYNYYYSNCYPQTGYNNTISVSNSNVQLTVGNSGVVTLYGNNNYNSGYNNNTFYITNNNSSIATATVNGNTLSIYGIAPGSTSVTVCSAGIYTNNGYNNGYYNNYGNSGCATVNVTVMAQQYYYNTSNQYYPPYPYNNGQYYYSPQYHCWMHY